MRRSERITMVRGLVLVGVVIVAVSGALVAHAPRGTAPQAHDRVPEDLFWPWAASCGAGIRSPLISFGSDADGRVEVEVGTLDPDAPYGTPLLDETGRPVVDEAASQPLLAALPVLARRHAVLVAGVRDPDLIEAVTTPPVDRRAIAVAGVATDLLIERDTVRARLAAGGAVVADATVDRLPSACVSAYLRLKSVARL